MNANDERDYAEEAANAQLMRDEHENPDAMLADPWRLYPLMILTLPEPEHWSDGGPGHTHHRRESFQRLFLHEATCDHENSP